jgi:endonuclease/exonuclease/phosphatase family metal-dependent hydrolase
MARKERGFFGKVIVFLLAFLAFIGLIAMILSVVNSYIDPKRFAWLAYFGLAFWEIFIFNVLIFFLLLLMWSRKVWIAVLALIISIIGVNKSYSFGSKVDANDSFKVMSYNVHNFTHVDKEMNKEDFANLIVSIVREQSPDVLCCQEFTVFKSGVSRTKCIDDFSKSVGLPYIYYNRKNNYGGNVIFSKYPVAKVSEDSGFGQENVYGVMVSVDAGERGLFYVANVHLLSYKITDHEIDILMSSSERRNMLDTIGMNLARKLKFAYERRSEEFTQMLQGMPPLEGPIIVCGDFNETPMSYVYRQMQKAGFTDTFTKVGRGIKPTYAGKLPLLRIDYMWANDQVRPMNFKRYRVKASDHYPIILEFSVDRSSAKPAMKPVENNLDNSEIQLNNTEII